MEISWSPDNASFTWNVTTTNFLQNQGYGPLELAFYSPDTIVYPITITQVDIWGYRPGPCFIGGQPVTAPLATRLRITLNDQSALLPQNTYLDEMIPACQSPACIQWSGEAFQLRQPLVLTGPRQIIYFFFYNSICPTNVLLIQKMLFHLDRPPIINNFGPPTAPTPPPAKKDGLFSKKNGLLIFLISLVVLFLLVIVLLFFLL